MLATVALHRHLVWWLLALLLWIGAPFALANPGQDPLDIAQPSTSPSSPSPASAIPASTLPVPVASTVTTPPPAVAPAAAAAAAKASTAPVATTAPEQLNHGNTAWMMMATVLVLLMTLPGVALFYGGMVRKKNVLATMAQVLAVAVVVTITWTLLGYSLAMRPGSEYLGGLDRLLLQGLTRDGLAGVAGANVPESVFMMFQMSFAIITAALVPGAVAERIKFPALLVFIALWSLLVYAPVAHWVWEPGGWLAKAGVLDYAGGTVVHINAGVAGLVCALVLGKRQGFGSEPLTPHNLTLTLVGGCLLWVGWFGFNAGSALAADGRAGMAMLVTHLASAMAAFSWLVVEWLLRGRPSALGLVSGAVAGLVAITPASGFVDANGALVIGAVAGVACYLGATTIKRAFAYDDSLDAFGIHGVGGAVGAVLTGLLAVPAVGGVSGNVLNQIIGVAFTAMYCGIATWLLLKLVDLTIGLRVSAEEEQAGLDITAHGESVA